MRLEELVELQTALLAKAKGFDWQCLHRIHDTQHQLYLNEPYSPIINLWSNLGPEVLDWNNYKIESTGQKLFTSLPSQAKLEEWLREKHGLIVLLGYQETIGLFRWYICKKSKGIIAKGGVLKDHKDSFESGLFKALTLIKNG